MWCENYTKIKKKSDSWKKYAIREGKAERNYNEDANKVDKKKKAPVDETKEAHKDDNLASSDTSFPTETSQTGSNLMIKRKNRVTPTSLSSSEFKMALRGLIKTI